MTRAFVAALLFALGCATAPRPIAPATAATTTSPAAPPVDAPSRRILSGEQPLGPRATPFAVYIAAMHRQIHARFTVGFLADIDARHDPAFADGTLWTQLEIAVNADGTVDHARVVRSSGLAAFDSAAADSVTAAAPFPPTPEMIRSADGKVHLDWQFRRDAVRGCGTPGVAPHILGAPASDAMTDYRAAMHQRIHAQFAVGYLAYLESNRHAPPFDDKTLWTEVTLALRGDGAIDHADIKRPSGLLAYDVAVLDSVMSAAPFPPPPVALLGADGLFHVDWTFHRDERACAFFGVGVPPAAN